MEVWRHAGELRPVSSLAVSLQEQGGSCQETGPAAQESAIDAVAS